jgi:5-methylcytosine-specific restriction protein A
MKYWIVPSNDHIFRIGDALKAQGGLVDWRMSNNFSIGDVVFIYKTKPEQRIRYRMEVVNVGLNIDEAFDQEPYWTDMDIYYSGLGSYKYVRFKLLEEYADDIMSLHHLHEHGLFGNIQGVQQCKNEELMKFLLNPYEKVNDDVYDVDYPAEDEELYEGAVIKVLANKYERNQKARKECIAKKGCKCLVCGLDFEETYGEKGRNFIHVHHVVPISSIGKEYQLNVETDLVPVCPNCHYMLHRKDPPYTILELKEYLIEQNLGAPLMAAEPDVEYNKSADLIVGVVKPESLEKFKKNEANMYYFGRKFPSKYNLKQIRYFAPYYEGGIRGYYDVNSVRTARKSEISDSSEESANNDIRIVLDLGTYHKILDKPQQVHLAYYSYAFLSLSDTF